MLTLRRVVTLALAFVLAWGAVAGAGLPAQAAPSDCRSPGGISMGCDDEVPADPGDPPDGPGGGGSGSERQCKVPGGYGLPEYVVDCRTDAGTWNASRLCYEKLVSPQPPTSDPVWDGNDEGYIVTCSPSEEWCNEVAIPGGTGPAACLTTTDGWQENPPGAPPADPAAIARRAFAALPLTAIDIGIVPEDGPGRVGLVGMPTWMWARSPTANQVGPRETSATDQGLTVSLDARVDRVVWDMGDGTTVTCDGPGTPYQDSYGKKESPDCGHTYTRQGEYQVTATTYWVADWTGGDQSGQLTDDFTSPATTITVGELQVLTR
ncbi:hypothetical protein ACFQ8E_02495 [Isoptericola sp. NPDC056573]|uniref:hypothetical protein n=1 Tax=unclassified Isoptericola TaxID=2623355 RepID=UPI0036BD5705